MLEKPIFINNKRKIIFYEYVKLSQKFKLDRRLYF